MGAYTQGGGGGRAGVTTADQFAFDQPYELGSTFTAETAAQINEMFRILFKAATRSQTIINAITTISSELLSKTVQLTAVNIAALSTTPKIVVTGVAGQIIVPHLRVIEANTVSGGSPGVTWQTVYRGLLSNLVFASVNTDFNVTRQKWFVDAPTCIIDDNTSLMGQDLLIQTSANPTGTHIATVTYYYTLITPTSIV